MKEAVTGQLIFFGASVGFGACLLLIYDILRGFRRVVIHSLFWSSVEDVLFWILAGISSFQFLCRYNYGQLRGFFFLGLGIGMILYYNGMSKKTVRICAFLFARISYIYSRICGIFQRPAKRMKMNLKWQLKKERKHVKMALKRGSRRGDMSEDKKKI